MKKRLVTLVNLVLNTLHGRNITIITSEGRYFLKTTPGHPLKRYLRQFDTYDRFLPYLCKAVSPKSIIDIGANIGDTLVLIKSVSNAEVICVEPDEKFIAYLKQNIELNEFTSVKLYPYPISATKKVVTIEKNALKSTSHMNEVSKPELHPGIPTKSFHDLLKDLALDINSVGIIKSDTDGYDWDCLNSIADYFDSAENINYPEFIFYEHQTYLNKLGQKDPDSSEREQRYQNALRRLCEFGYTQFYVFDNFGHLVDRTGNLDALFSITDSLSKAGSPKKISNYFVDVLMTGPSNLDIVEKALLMQAEKQMMID